MKIPKIGSRCAQVGDLRVSMDGNGDAAFMTTRSDERTASGIPDVFANTEISGVVGDQQQLALESVRGKITAGLPGESVAVGGWEHVEAKGIGRDSFEIAEYRLGTGWTHPVSIPILTPAEQNSSFSPSHQINHSAVVALEPGRRLAVVNTNKKLRYNVGSPEGDWNAAADVITSSGINPVSVHFLATGGNGRAVLLWVEFLSGSADYIVLSTWFNGVTWGPIESIATQTGIIVFEDSFRVAADAQGNAVVVWEHITATAGKTIRSVRYRDGQWEAPIELSSAGADPSLSVNARGDTAAVWVESPGVIVGRSFTAQNPATWSNPAQLTKVAGGNAFEPKVAIQPDGSVIVIWTKIQDVSLWSTAGRIE